MWEQNAKKGILKMDNNYKKYLNSKEWKEKRDKRLEIDGFKCTCCGTKDRLNVHHTTYERLGHESMEDLITLCNDCHKAIHNNYGENRNGWAKCLCDGDMEIINSRFLPDFFESIFAAKGRLLSYLILNRSEWNIVIGTIKSIAFESKTSIQTVSDAIKCMRAQNIVKTRTGALMFNPSFIKAKGDEGDGKLESKYENFELKRKHI